MQHDVIGGERQVGDAMWVLHISDIHDGKFGAAADKGIAAACGNGERRAAEVFDGLNVQVRLWLSGARSRQCGRRAGDRECQHDGKSECCDCFHRSPPDH